MHQGLSLAGFETDRLTTVPIAAIPAGAPLLASIAIIVPTLNERDNIAPLVAALDRAMAGRRAEIVFVDDWSTDGTPEAITELARRRADIRLLRRHGRRGLSSAVIEGMLSTSADIVAVIDADLQHDERILPDLVAAVAAGSADVAIGSRYSAGGSCGDWPASRELASRLATRMATAAVGRAVADPLSGFFALRRDLAVELVPRLRGRGYKILLDMLSSAPRPLDVVEVAYRFRSRVAGESKLSTGVVIDYCRLVAVRGLARALTPARLLGALALVAAALLLARVTSSMLADLGVAAACIAAVGALWGLSGARTKAAPSRP